MFILFHMEEIEKAKNKNIKKWKACPIFISRFTTDKQSRRLHKYVYNMSTICLQYVYNMSTIFEFERKNGLKVEIKRNVISSELSAPQLNQQLLERRIKIYYSSFLKVLRVPLEIWHAPLFNNKSR